jgi:hypothetical protein
MCQDLTIDGRRSSLQKAKCGGPLRVEGADRVPGDASRVLYLVVSGAPAAEGLPSLVTLLQEAGWRVVVFPTPTGTRFADLNELEVLAAATQGATRCAGTGTRLTRP